MRQPSLEERSHSLHGVARQYIEQGYRVQYATATEMQLIKPKRFNLFWAFVWFLLFGVGILVSIAYYVSKDDNFVYIVVEDNGMVSVEQRR
jgi:hypothetical protein